jgi:hypothetical protein
MIQRVQTLFLLGLIVCMALLFIFPIWEKVNPDTGTKYALDAFYWMELTENPEGWEVINSKPAYYLAGLAALSCLVALYSIFQFKKAVNANKAWRCQCFRDYGFCSHCYLFYIYWGKSDRV